MAKTSIEVSSTTESLIFAAENSDKATAIRVRLVNESSGCWFFLYTHTNEIHAAGEFGGKLSKEKIKELQALATKFNASFVS